MGKYKNQNESNFFGQLKHEMSEWMYVKNVNICLLCGIYQFTYVSVF